MKNKIIVVGGYGCVGKTICKELGEKFPGVVYAAGRNLERAEQLSRETDGKVKSLQLDIQEAVHPDALDQARLVIMCLDQTNSGFVRSCFQSGTHYIDVSANGRFLNQVEQWSTEAEKNRATAVLSVGLAPGLTNLLALQAQKLLDQAESIELSILLSLGGRHGKAAIEWTIDNLNTSFSITENNRQVTVNSFTDGKIVDFGAILGRKKAYRFPFSDQQTLVRTLEVPSVSTRLCFDSAVATAFMSGLRKIGAFRLLQVHRIRNAMIRSFEQLHFGGDQFAVKVDAWGRKGGKDAAVECLLQGKDQSNMTAKVAVCVADALYSQVFPHGVYHIEQLFELKSMQDWLQQEASIEIRIDGVQLGYV
ncbi:saccharopine dehydrogenase family protein [Aneurinibacillus migulanus]|uniref:Saccharopine dehydrogenase n=1 Tax=Aneurinibacillus migulanus TaxID=47500 RepID=A0A0D1W6J9_ANEMI|nr:saccharopine dehydrogenase NADP-binding domain-containing protein [Aneurinibacillus migulanus]KIV54060.1 saccharopine dehydrogenase [Aneurinibacillus migulanus]KON97694.1 saccharopine dehydrogenase [Aneurinibacillus migulanus]MED0894459.1 saccharopine dehydrogenase NADP-binding domain-containing protein [Aneurinibacillus migulanus]MED1617069.1 saccharopine dehydrogenase NADP-binding domain-containing protein [Aneurinibacillus migulanus]SDJ34599.1 Saccharopine dehydrogenase, NADP-dependent [